MTEKMHSRRSSTCTAHKSTEKLLKSRLLQYPSKEDVDLLLVDSEAVVVVQALLLLVVVGLLPEEADPELDPDHLAEVSSETDLLVVPEADPARDQRSAEDFRDHLHAPDLDRDHGSQEANPAPDPVLGVTEALDKYILCLVHKQRVKSLTRDKSL